MSPDFSEWKALQDTKRIERDTQIAFHRQTQERVAVDMQYVTQSEHWNTFLEHIQAMITAEERSIKGLEGLLRSPSLADPVEIGKLRNNLMLADQRIIAFRQCLELPKRLMEAGEKINLDNGSERS